MHETIKISGKYRNLVTQMSRLILEQIKVSKHERLSYEVIMFKEIVNKDIPLHFYLVDSSSIETSTKLLKCFS